MNMKDAFRFQNKLQTLMGTAQDILSSSRNITSPPPMKGTKRYRKEQKRAAKKARRQSIAHVLTLIENLDTQARVARSM